MTTTTQPKYTAVPEEEEEEEKFKDAVEDDDDTGDSHQPRTDTKRPSRRWTCNCCCICGWITVTLLLSLMGLGIAGYWTIARTVRRLTVASPLIFPIITLPPEELFNFTRQHIDFINCLESFDDVHNISMTEELIVPSRYLNGVISEMDGSRGYAHVVMNSNELLFQTSIPIMRPIPGGKNRFFVVTVNITTVVTNCCQSRSPETAAISVSLDLGPTSNEDDDEEGPVYLIEFESYFGPIVNQNQSNQYKYDWVLTILRIREFGRDIFFAKRDKMKHATFLQFFKMVIYGKLGEERNINVWQSLYDDPQIRMKDNHQFIKVMNSIQSIRIEPDQLVIRPRNSNYNCNKASIWSSGVSILQQIFKLQ